MASGYAIFLIHGEIQEKPAHFALALLGAAAVSYVIEWLRDLIRVGEIEKETHPIIRSFGTFVVVLVFELFISGFHAGLDMGSTAVLGAAGRLMGEEASAVQGVPWTVVLVAGVWVVAGALLAAWLSMRVGGGTKSVDAQHVVRSSGWGTVGGMVIAPLVIGMYILVGRCVVTLEYFARSSPEMAAKYPSLTDMSHVTGHNSGAGWVLLFELPMNALRTAAAHGLWVFWLVYGGMFLALFIVLAIYGDSKKATPPILNFVMLGAVVALGIPVAQSVWAVLKQLMHKEPLEALLGAMVLGAVIWGVPGMLLGALVPLLRRAGRSPQSWAFIGYGSAGVLVLASLLTRHAWPLLPAAIALGAGLLFHRGMPVKEFWPFAALCVAIGVSGAMSVAQSITFRGVLLKLHTIDALTPPPPEPVTPPASESAQTPGPILSPGQFQALEDELMKRQRKPAAPAVEEPATESAEKKEAPEPEKHDAEPGEETPEEAAKALEISIAGSVGFWITVGLLACWSMWEREEEEAGEHAHPA